MTRLDRILDNIVIRLIMADVEITWILAVSKCIDVDKLMTKTCPYCDQKFKKKRSLSNHILHKHTDEIVKIIECATEIIKKWRETNK